jgi:phage shock protein A|tara:strand:- start:818 stop:1123 length:306 start_codon:yes stop_codon:yes gene_type:complete
MALIKRLSRLFEADLHAVLDQIEEPQALLKQSVREMAEELAKGEQHLKEMRTEHSHLSRRSTEIEGSLVDMEGELDLCFESNNDDLARQLLKRKLLTEKVL